MPTRREYTEEDKATALAALAANNGDVKATADQIGMPRRTLHNWSRGINAPTDDGLVPQKKGHLADACEEIAWKLLESLQGKIGKATLSQAATSFGIMVDKAKILRGESVSGDINVFLHLATKNYDELQHELEATILRDAELDRRRVGLLAQREAILRGDVPSHPPGDGEEGAAVGELPI